MKHPILALAWLACTATVWADGPLTAQHGGVMAEAASGLRVELVNDASGLAVYLREHSDKPLSSKGISGDIVLLGSQGKTTLALTPAEGNKLTASAPASAGAKAIVRLNLPGKGSDQVRLTLK